MGYSISQISVRDLHLLYHYRILKHPHEFLNPIWQTHAEEVKVPEHGSALAGLQDAYGRGVYIYDLPLAYTPKVAGPVPLLEFQCPSDNLGQLADLRYVDVLPGGLRLYAACSKLTDLTITCRWCPSLQDVYDTLDAFKDAMTKFKDELDLVRKELTRTAPNRQVRLDGKDEHLVKLNPDVDRLDALVDAEVYIQEGGLTTRTILGPSTQDLQQLPRQIRGTLRIEYPNRRDVYLDGFHGGTIEIAGRGNLYLYNITSTINLSAFIGDVYANQCSYIKIQGLTSIGRLELSDTNCDLLGGRVHSLTTTRCSVVRHDDGTLNEIRHIGVGCTYQTNVRGPSIKMKEPSNVLWSHIQGTYLSSNGDVIKHGNELSFVTGHHDDPNMVSEISFTPIQSVIPDTGKGTDPTPPVTGGLAIPAAYYPQCTEDYRMMAFNQAFMTTSSGPQTISDITSESFHTLRACMNWCCGEFGPSIYGASYGKLIRTWCMYQPDSAYRGKGKTLTDFIQRLRDQVLSWGGKDIWNRSYADLKSSTWITDAYALQFMQDLYNNIRYPDLFGVTASSDADVIKAMSCMPVMNETTNLGVPNIPDRNKPVAWSVVKMAVLNEFSGYQGWYVLYRPVAYSTNINYGTNPAVKPVVS